MSAAADQASPPGLGIWGNTHILAQIGIHVHTRACRRASLTHGNAVSNACTHTMPPVVKKGGLMSTCVDSLPTYSPTPLKQRYLTLNIHCESIFSQFYTTTGGLKRSAEKSCVNIHTPDALMMHDIRWMTQNEYLITSRSRSMNHYYSIKWTVTVHLSTSLHYVFPPTDSRSNFPP